MSRRMQNEHDEAFRIVFDVIPTDWNPAAQRIVGPYATIGAAKGQATSETGNYGRYKGRPYRVQRTIGWEDVFAFPAEDTHDAADLISVEPS